MKKNEVVIPILMITWNRLGYTKQAIKSIKENTHHPYILWIWDNGSTDETVEYLKSIKSKSIIINLKDKNYKLIPPMNEFFNKFKNSKYIAKVDNDTVVPPYWLTKFKDVMENVPLFVIQADHCLEQVYKIKNSQEFYNELETIEYKGEKLYLFPHVGGSGILIRNGYINTFIKEEGSIFSWTSYQEEKCYLNNTRCAFYGGVRIRLLDMENTNKIRRNDYPEYNKKLNMMRYGNEHGVGRIDLNIKYLKSVKRAMSIVWR